MKCLLLFFSISVLNFNAMAEETKSHTEYMEAMKKTSTPGEQHALLKKMAGSWTTVSKVWQDSKSQPTESVGTSDIKLILGDRFLSEEFHGTHMDQTFTGVGLMGFDNIKKKFVSTWADDMSTGIMISYGTIDKSGKVITSTGDYDDPLTKKAVKLKMITRIEDDNKHVFEMWHKDQKGVMYKSMEIIYTKKQ